MLNAPLRAITAESDKGQALPLPTHKDGNSPL